MGAQRFTSMIELASNLVNKRLELFRRIVGGFVVKILPIDKYGEVRDLIANL
jgi:hypothetical protein